MWGLIFLEVPTPSLLLAYARKGFAYAREHVRTCAYASLRAWVSGWICLRGHSVSNVWICFVVCFWGCGLAIKMERAGWRNSHRFVCMLTSPRNSAKKQQDNFLGRVPGCSRYLGGDCVPVSVFAYASPTFRLREAYAGGKYIFRISESKMKQKLCKHNWETGSPSGTVYRLLPQTLGFSSCIILIYGDCLRKVSLLHTMIASSCSLLHALDPKAKDSVRIRRLRGDCQNITHKKCLRGPTPPS